MAAVASVEQKSDLSDILASFESPETAYQV